MTARTAKAFALALLVAAPVLTAGCVRPDGLLVALSAPKAASGMTLFLVTDPGLVGKLAQNDESAEYAIYFGDRLLYPPGGKGADFPVEGRTGSVFIPYNLFVVGNGEYDVVVKLGGQEARARVTVEKWVEYVYLRPFERGNVVVVEAALASATGARPEDRILADGELVLHLKYRGKDGREDRTLGSITTFTRHEQISTRVEVPRTRFTQGPGYYSFEPLFHNDEAKDNVQVSGDPTMRNHQPPWNWVYIAQ